MYGNVQEEVHDEPATNPAATFFHTIASTPAFHELLTHTEVDPARQQARACGQWLVCQRIRHAISLDHAITVLGVDAQTFALLELGLVEPAVLDNKRIFQLAILLADN